MAVTFREYQAGDAEAVRRLLNVVFTRAHMSPESWARWTREGFAAPVALVNGVVRGAIPLARRSYRVAPGAEVVAWVEHRVGVAGAWRAHGFGSGMQSCAKEFLRGRGDVLLVHRGAERSPGYRFYERNGLHDVSYMHAATLEPEADSPDGVRWISADEFAEGGELWHRIFESCYAACGGYLPRRPGYQVDMIQSETWREAIRHEFSYCVAEKAGETEAYLILGLRGGQAQVMELASADGAVEPVERLLRAARGRGAPVRCCASLGSPIAQAVRRMGLAPPPREHGSMIMVHVVDIESAGRKVWRAVPELEAVEVRVWTPEREGVVHAVESPTRTLVMEMKEHTLSRLLMRRLDVAVAVAEERITLCGDEPGDAEALRRALPPAPWVYLPLDYL